jgi:putative transposase
MAWIPKHLTRLQMEQRRREAARLLRAGKLSQTEIARQLSVNRVTVCDWAKQLAEGGLRALRRRTSTGRPARLTRAEKQSLLRQLKRGAIAAGFATDGWTMRRVRQLIAREFGVQYHLHYINRLLAALGWSLQQPLPRAAERDETLIRAWLDQDWPRIKKGAATRRKHSVFR